MSSTKSNRKLSENDMVKICEDKLIDDLHVVYQKIAILHEVKVNSIHLYNSRKNHEICEDV